MQGKNVPVDWLTPVKSAIVHVHVFAVVAAGVAVQRMYCVHNLLLTLASGACDFSKPLQFHIPLRGLVIVAVRIMSWISPPRMISTVSLSGSLGVTFLKAFTDTAGLHAMQLSLHSRG